MPRSSRALDAALSPGRPENDQGVVTIPRAVPALDLAFAIVGRLVSIAVLGFAILSGRGNPLLFLWVLWIEEVLTLAGLAASQALVRRGRRGDGSATVPFGVYVLFPVVHLVFVVFYSFIAAGGLFSSLGATRLAMPPLGIVLFQAGVLAFWIVVDLVRAVLQRRGGVSPAAEDARIDREARLALFLPHVTIIAGGLCLIVLRLGNWLAWGVLAGKVLFEALSFTSRRGAPLRAPDGPGDASRGGG